MFLKLRKTLIATTFVASTLVYAPTGEAGGIEPVQRLGRLLGVGWGDGYHSCADSGFRPGANMPPRSYHKQFNHQPSCGGFGLNGTVDGHTFYDHFDSASRCQSCRGAGCQRCGTARQEMQGGYHSNGAASRTSQSYRAASSCQDGGCDSIYGGQLTETPMELPQAPFAPRVETSRTPESAVRLAAELAESQKRPIRPLPPQTKRQINIPDPIARPNIPRPIRPMPPVPHFKVNSDPGELPATGTPNAPNLLDAVQAERPTEKQILNKAINDIVLPDYAKRRNAIGSSEPDFPAESAGHGGKPLVELVPQVAKVPEWMVVRQPR